MEFSFDFYLNKRNWPTNIDKNINLVCSHCKKTVRSLNQLNIHAIQKHNKFMEFQISEKEMANNKKRKHEQDTNLPSSKQPYKPRNKQTEKPIIKQRQIEGQRNKQMIKQRQREDQTNNHPIEQRQIEIKTNNQSLGQRKREEDVETNEHQIGEQIITKKGNKLSFCCPTCGRTYKMQHYLGVHIDKHHNGEENNYSGQSTEHYYKRIDYSISTTQFNYRVNVTEARLLEDQRYNRDRKNSLRFSRFNHRSFKIQTSLKNKTADQQMVIQYQEGLPQILPAGFHLRVLRVKQFRAKDDKYDVSFSEDTDVPLLFYKLLEYCKKNNASLQPKQNSKNNKLIEFSFSPATKVRLAILDAIGSKVCKNTQKKFETGCENFIPVLIIYDQDTELHNKDYRIVYPFIKAVSGFNSEMNTKDFSEAYKLFKKYQFKDEDRVNFIVNM